ncbi:hypothetical protein L21SP2_0339 [Salinispira pacifica]|uniref:Uncharacterized protein n=1 Tax=Salinispira pacifica TaxID=1307761 RepID=V5WDT0_9SPIO|nr:hypothetical protein L21SP2_0339 [Salinispira pacifica]
MHFGCILRVFQNMVLNMSVLIYSAGAYISHSPITGMDEI